MVLPQIQKISKSSHPIGRDFPNFGKPFVFKKRYCGDGARASKILQQGKNNFFLTSCFHFKKYIIVGSCFASGYICQKTFLNILFMSCYGYCSVKYINHLLLCCSILSKHFLQKISYVTGDWPTDCSTANGLLIRNKDDINLWRILDQT